jgi:hypothetical protein
VLFSSLIGLWTVRRFVELGHKEKGPENPFSDAQGIPITDYGAPMGKNEYDSDAEGSSFVNRPYEPAGYQAPAYQAAPYRPGLGNGYHI